MTAIDLGAGFTITALECDGYVCWEVTGDLDVFRSPRLSEAMVAACVGGRCRHVVDLTAVESLDASAVRVLVSVHKLVRSEGGLAVAALPESQVWSTLAATGAARILRVFGRRDQAITALTPRRRVRR